MVVNIVDVGWATSKSGCLPISAFTVLALPPLFVLALLAEREGRRGVGEEEEGEREAKRGRMGMRKNKERDDRV